MKRIVSCLVGVLLLSACSQIEQSVPEDNFLNGDIVERVVFDVLPIKDGDDPETKASAVPSADGKTVEFAWEENDMVGIYPDKGSQIYFNIEDGAGTSSAIFTGGGWALKQNSTYVSYYPFVADFFLSRDAIPISFSGQKQVGTTPPFSGAKYVLASAPATSENGVLRFTYSTLNTIINVNATLPAGTYTKASLTVDEPLFKEEGTFSLDNMEIIGTKFSNTLEIDLASVTLTDEGTIPIYIMSAPVDLSGKDVVVRIQSSEGKTYKCVKNPSKEYLAGTRYGLTCDKMVEELVGNISFADTEVKRICVENWDSNGDGEMSYEEAAEVDDLGEVFRASTISVFDELQYFTGLTSISDNAFYGSNALSSIVIPNGVTSIGKYSFFVCSNLSSVILPEGLESIGLYAFHNCKNLTSVDIPESVTSIGDYAFYDCISLDSIEFPKHCLSIGKSAFSGCNSLISIIIPNGITTIGKNAFKSSSITAVVVPGSVALVEEGVFEDCSHLITVELSEGITSIGNEAFYGCSSLKSITIPSSVTSLGGYCFRGCTSLTSVVLSEGLTSIGEYAFMACKGLTSIDIPSSVTTIGSSAFVNCKGLTSLLIPAGVTSIGETAFSGCSGLTEIECKSFTPPSGGSSMFTSTNNCPIYVPASSVSSYKTAEYWKTYASRISSR